MKFKKGGFLDKVIPRFITEEVALRLSDDGVYEIICTMEDVTTQDKIDASCFFRSFNFFGSGWFPKPIDSTFKILSRD